ncbi:MAG: SoxR reducing system RseC family protein [bacterium]
MNPESPARVVRVAGGNAEVEVTARGACGGCSNAAVCGAVGGKQRVLLARNPVGAAPGDWVAIQVSEARGTLSAVLVFGVPAALMLAGVLAGGLLMGDLWAGILAGVGLVLGVVIVTIVDRQVARSGRGLPEIVRKIESPEELDCKGGGSEAVADDSTSARDGDGTGTGQ